MYYETAIMMEPNLDAKHWADYGFVLYQLGNYEGAEEKLSYAIAQYVYLILRIISPLFLCLSFSASRHPLPPECFVNYGLVQMKLNRYNEAAGNFKYAIERSVLKDARATPFLSDFIQAFEKVDDGQKEKFNECLEVCKAGLMEQNAAPNS